ncbi:AfsA-related hotdog domain-containing protein [Dactylosporangium sp. NPDC051541]|uniref:AfsA-related hotdog domain-containing protein n=1 Tax=Dactylosporangium sp. NPDC051541 TaxID=3363977 RepID=UPI0037BAAF99
MTIALAPQRPLPGLLDAVAPAEAWRAGLVIDGGHPFFFDHPLDHVPGIQLVTALLELVRAAAAGTAPDGPGRIDTALWFPQFCELDEPTELRVVRPAAGGECWSVQAAQSRGSVCQGWVRYHSEVCDAGAPMASPTAGTTGPDRADGALVHRARPENILVGPVRRDEGGVGRAALVRSSAEDHFFTVRGAGVRHCEELIEAARQVAVLQWPSEHAWPVDVRLTLNRLRADLPAAVAADRDLELRWQPRPLRGTKSTARVELHDRAEPGAGRDAVPLGRFVIETQGFTEPQWRQLRAGAR